MLTSNISCSVDFVAASQSEFGEQGSCVNHLYIHTFQLHVHASKTDAVAPAYRDSFEPVVHNIGFISVCGDARPVFFL